MSLRGQALGSLLAGRIWRWMEFGGDRSTRLGLELATAAPDALAAALSSARAQKDSVMVYVCLKLAHGAGADPAVYEGALPTLLSRCSSHDASGLHQALQDLALRMVPGAGPSREAAIQCYRRKLGAADPQERARLLIQASHLGEAAEPFLEDIGEFLAVEDPELRTILDGEGRWLESARERFTAAMLRIRHGDDAPFEALRSESPARRRLGIAALSGRRLAEERVLRALSQALHDTDARVRHEAAWRLLSGGPPGLEVLAKAGSKEDHVRNAALAAAARSARTVWLPGASTIVHARSLPHRREEDAVRLDTTPLLGLALSALGDGDPRVRALAARALGGMGPSAAEAVGALRVLLDDAEPETRANAAEALGMVSRGERETVRAVVQLLRNEPARDVQEAAAHALARMSGGDAGGLAATLGALAHTEELAQPRWLAEAAVVMVEANDSLQSAVIQGLLSLPDPARAALVAELGVLSAPSADLIQALVGCLGDGGRTGDVRRSAARSLEQLAQRDESVVAAVSEALQGSAPGVRAMAAEVLGGIGYPARGAVVALEKAARSEDSKLRAASEAALESLRLK